MSITPATLRIQAELRALLDGILDAQTRAIVEAWVTAWDSVVATVDAAATDLVNAATNGRVTRTMVLRSARAQAALEAVADALTIAAHDTALTITGDLRAVIDAAVDAETRMATAQLTGRRAHLAAGFTRADPTQIAQMITRATERITATTRPLSAEAQAAVRRELLRGTAVGDNPRTTARRMVRGIEDKFDGGTTRALVISRTETLDAARRAQADVDKANADVLAGWAWVADLSARTCQACFGMHGTLHDLTEPGPLGHQQCRCVRVPRTKSWAELGFPGIADAADQTPDAAAFFDSLTPAQQVAILGPARHAAWKRGDYPMSVWARRQANPGWRDSYTISPAPRA